jgi:tetratricopeptide (TPR) repeat protein
MAETSVAALDPRLQKQVESARIAYGRGNFDYTIALCRSVLKEKPSCLSVRKLHRTAALRLQHGSGAPFVVAFGSLANGPLILRPDVRPDKEPLAAVENSEKMIENDAHSMAALRLLGHAAATLGWKETAVFAYESMREEAPRDCGNLVALGEAQLAAGRADEAVATAEQALKIDPVCDRAFDLLRDASVAQTVEAGRW